MSDIFEFAQWEAQNRNLSQEQTSQEEQRLKEMEGARDSSNDPSTDAEESEGEEVRPYGVREVFTTSPRPRHERSSMEETEDSDDGESVDSLLPKVRQEIEVAEYEKLKTYFPESQRQAVEAYAKDHPFYAQANDAQTEELIEELIEEYTRDIYVFARASGLGKHAATLEVMRARASWEQHAGVGDGLQLEFESDTELEMFMAPKLKDAARYYPQTPVVQVQDIQYDDPLLNANLVRNVASGGAGRKRKHNEVEQEKTEKENIQKMAKLAKQQKKKERKKEKKAKKLAKQAGKEDKFGKSRDRSRSKEITAHDIQLQAVDDNSEIEDVVAPQFHHVTALLNIKATKKRLKPGPTTSTYFAKPAAIGRAEEWSTISGNSIEGPKPSARSLARKRKREREKVKVLKATTSEHDKSSLQAVQQASAGSGASATAFMVASAPKSKDGQAFVDGALKRKRKKKRNKNRLSEIPALTEEPKGPIHALENAQRTQEHNELTQLQVEKRLATHIFVQNLPSAEPPADQLLGVEGDLSLESTKASQSVKEQLLKKVDRARKIEEDVSPEGYIGLASDNEAPQLSFEKNTSVSSSSTQLTTGTLNKDANPKSADNAAGHPHKRRDRGRRRSLHIAEGDQDSAGGDQLLDGHITQLGENTEAEIRTNASKSPEITIVGESPSSTVQVVIYSPSKTWVPPDSKIASAAEEKPPADDDDRASVFSMSHYGPLDWDHSGDEFDDTQVAPKISRRNSTLSGVPYHAIFAFPPKSSNESAPTSAQIRDGRGRFSRRVGSHTPSRSTDRQPLKPTVERDGSGEEQRSSSAASTATRDNRGRFTRRMGSPAPSKAAPWTPSRSQGDAAKSSREQRSTSSASARAGDNRSRSSTRTGSPTSRRFMQSSTSKPPPERDHKGRFRSKSEPAPAPPSKSIVPVDNAPKIKGPAKAEQANGKLKKATTKAKRVPIKSPFFSPASTPCKTSKASKAKCLKTENLDPSARPFIDELSLSQPQTPTSFKDGSSSKSTPKRPRTPGSTISCIPFPPLSSPTFGLIQEKLADDPFRLLIAVTFLIRTHGKHAIPVFFELMEKYPTPESLVAANKDDIVPIIRHLGLQNQRAGTYQMYANMWLLNPPTKDRRYAVRGYPTNDSGRNIPKDEILTDDDEREAWEIGHMTQGPYALDSWRIFCRDRLRGIAEGWNGEGTDEGFQPEWMRVMPEDKELRAFLRWMWLKEGFEWDPFTGEKEVAGGVLMRAAMEGRIAWDDKGGVRILDGPMEGIAVIDELIDSVEDL